MKGTDPQGWRYLGIGHIVQGFVDHGVDIGFSSEMESRKILNRVGEKSE